MALILQCYLAPCCLKRAVPERLYDAFKNACCGEGRTMNWVVNQMLEDYVSKGK